MERKKQAYELIYAPAVEDHLRAIDRKHYPLIRSSIEEQLRHEPMIETRNRKPLKRTFPSEPAAIWELRFGPDNAFRVFYIISPEDREVHILAIGVKDRNRLFIAGEEVET